MKSCPRAENSYPADVFYGQVRRFPWPDHHPPPLSMIPLFTRAMSDWLQGDRKRIAVIHCKGVPLALLAHMQATDEPRM